MNTKEFEKPRENRIMNMLIRDFVCIRVYLWRRGE